MYFSEDYEVSVYQMMSPVTTNAYGLDPASNKSIPGTPDPEAIWEMYFKWRKMHWIAKPDILDRINGTRVCLTCAIVCHSLRAWQTGIYLEICVLKPDAVGGEPDPESGII